MSRYLSLDDSTCWPDPNTDTAWTLQYGTPTREDLMFAASALAAYHELVALPARVRNEKIALLRRANVPITAPKEGTP